MMFYYVLVALYVLVCLFLLIAILLQQGRAGDIASAFGAAAARRCSVPGPGRPC